MLDRPYQVRAIFVAALFSVLVLSSCTSGSTQVTNAGDTGQATGPTATSGSTGVATGSTGATGASGQTSIAGTWDGTWESDAFDVSGSFSMTFTQTAGGFSGTIQIQDSGCVSDGTVEAALDGSRITIGAVQAGATITFDGEVSGDEMGGTYSSPPECGSDTGTWEAQLT